MTRALKNAVLQQQMIDVDKALQILDQETPPLVVDRDKLKVCGILWKPGLFFSLIDTGQMGFLHHDFTHRSPKKLMTRKAYCGLSFLHPALFGLFLHRRVKFGNSKSNLRAITLSLPFLPHFFRSCWREQCPRLKATRSTSWRNSMLCSARASIDTDETTTKLH